MVPLQEGYQRVEDSYYTYIIQVEYGDRVQDGAVSVLSEFRIAAGSSHVFHDNACNAG